MNRHEIPGVKDGEDLYSESRGLEGHISTLQISLSLRRQSALRSPQGLILSGLQELINKCKEINQRIDRLTEIIKNNINSHYPQNICFAISFLSLHKENRRFINNFRKGFEGLKNFNTNDLPPALINEINLVNEKVENFIKLFEETVNNASDFVKVLFKRDAEKLGLEEFSVFKGKVLLVIIFFLMAGNKRSKKYVNAIKRAGSLTGKKRIATLRNLRLEEAKLDDPLESVLYKPDDLLEALYWSTGFGGINSIEDFYTRLKGVISLHLQYLLRENTDFFYGYYGQNLNIDLTIVITQRPAENEFLGFVRPIRRVVKAFKPSSASYDTIDMSFQDPNHVEIFFSIKELINLLRTDPNYLRSAIMHEWAHWLTKDIKSDKSGHLNRIFSEGIARFSEYCHNPNNLRHFIDSNLILELLNNPVSIMGMAKRITENGRIAYDLGLYMCLIIYAYKVAGKEARVWFGNRLDELAIIQLATGENRRKAFLWLRVFTGMNHKTFFKQYVKAVEAMGVKPLFNESAMNALLKY